MNDVIEKLMEASYQLTREIKKCEEKGEFCDDEVMLCLAIKRDVLALIEAAKQIEKL